MAEHAPPSADPFRDTDVIDARAPRFAQAVTGTVALLGAIFGWPLAWALMSANILMGLTLGRQWCLPCLAYFKLVQPRFGEGGSRIRGPRGSPTPWGPAFLGPAAARGGSAPRRLGTALGLLVAALALLAASTGFCAGCEIYRLFARLRGISPRHHAHIDPEDLPGLNGAREAYVEFTHPMCGACRVWETRLAAGERPLVKLDVSERPDLARKYGVAIVPTVVAVARDGTVLERLAP